MVAPSEWAITGLYSYPPDVFDVIRTLKESARGEFEITDVNNHYIDLNKCFIDYLHEDHFWSDAGTPESLYEVIQWAHEK